VFIMGTDTREIVSYLRGWWQEKLAAEAARD
jgi:hypothetical protein